MKTTVAIKKGLGHKKTKTMYNAKSIYDSIIDNHLCLYFGNNGHFKDWYTAKFEEI